MQNLKNLLETLKEEWKRQSGNSEVVTIRERVDTRMKVLQGHIETQCSLAAACGNEKQWVFDIAIPDGLANILADIQWMMGVYGILCGKTMESADSFGIAMPECVKEILNLSFREEEVRESVYEMEPGTCYREVCNMVLNGAENFRKVPPFLQSCFDALWKQEKETITGVVSAYHYSRLPEKCGLIPFEKRDTLEKRRAILDRVALFLDSIPEEELRKWGEDPWFDVICYGSFLTERYQETSDLDLMVLAESTMTAWEVQERLEEYLKQEGLFCDVTMARLERSSAFYQRAMFGSTWLYREEVPDEVGKWIKEMVKTEKKQ